MTAEEDVAATSSATAAAVLCAVGGAANVVGLARCWSRLRFVLTDPALADLEVLGALGTVAVVAFQQGELQVALSRGLAEVFDAVDLALGPRPAADGKPHGCLGAGGPTSEAEQPVHR